MLYQRRVLDALLEFVTPWFLAFLGGNGFVNVGGHAEVMSESLAVARKFLADIGDARGVHLQASQCRFTSFFVRSVFYLGPEGTFSHILARKRFRRHAILVPCPTVEAVFERVLAVAGDLGIVPIENSSGGTVYDTVDLLIRHAGQIFIHEELALDVRIALLGRPGKAIAKVFSHFVQIKHHAEWLKARHPRARLHAVASTAVAAQKAAASSRAAALASPGAAEVYGLEVLELPSLGQTVNVTHFFVIGASAPDIREESQKTALVAALPNVCGSLHKFLGPFAREKVNLSRIVSRPVPGKPQTYVFFLEIDGSPQSDSVDRALVRAHALAESMTSLGTYPGRRRFKS
jgi:chorismate mutase / prephenate dehydratase